jgi:hypothetical protein
MQLTLIRDIDDSRSTVGRWIHKGHEFCQSIEQPWTPHDEYRAGTPFKSCVPDGLYGLVQYTSSRFINRDGSPLVSYRLENADLGVWTTEDKIAKYGRPGDRYGCSVHWANWAYQLQGCTAAGIDRREWKNTYMVTESRKAIAKLMDLLYRDEINMLEIKSAANLRKI